MILPNLFVSGFSPTEDGIHSLVITSQDAPENFNANLDLIGGSYQTSDEHIEFLRSAVGMIIYKKEPGFNGVVSAISWKPLNSPKVFERMYDEVDKRYEYTKLNVEVTINP